LVLTGESQLVCECLSCNAETVKDTSSQESTCKYDVIKYKTREKVINNTTWL